jgi:hypothetical protein
MYADNAPIGGRRCHFPADRFGRVKFFPAGGLVDPVKSMIPNNFRARQSDL